MLKCWPLLLLLLSCVTYAQIPQRSVEQTIRQIYQGYAEDSQTPVAFSDMSEKSIISSRMKKALRKSDHRGHRHTGFRPYLRLPGLSRPPD
ncbi:hypothetical protein [Klebsiella aerogenes]|uniref:hypothetical protein n=1 Tax=Klebsiella aerogenes TaxID=548 RepID=UPI000A87180A|nr:hypothetical protein [Klebsiella aerogenes]